MADAQQIYRVLGEFVKQAEICTSCVPAKTLDITYGTAVSPNPNGQLSLANDSINLEFILPSGYKVWPNDISPYDATAVRFAWNNTTGAATIANASDKASLDAVTPQSLVKVTTRSSKLLNIDLWPLDTSGSLKSDVTNSPDGGYRLCVATRPPMPDTNYTNPDDSGDFMHYRTAKVCGTIFPRNW